MTDDQLAMFPPTSFQDIDSAWSPAVINIPADDPIQVHNKCLMHQWLLCLADFLSIKEKRKSNSAHRCRASLCAGESLGRGGAGRVFDRRSRQCCE